MHNRISRFVLSKTPVKLKKITTFQIYSQIFSHNKIYTINIFQDSVTSPNFVGWRSIKC